MSNPCELCKHYGPVGWKHKSFGFGCTLANTSDGTDGYGPFYSSPKCILDQDAGKLKNLFETTSEPDMLLLKKLVELKQERIHQLESTIKNLERDIVLISKNKIKE